MYGAVEAGGTKFVCALVDTPGIVVAEERFPTAGRLVLPGCALRMEGAWRVWLPARRLNSAGGLPVPRCLRTTRRGNWKLSTLPTRY